MPQPRKWVYLLGAGVLVALSYFALSSVVGKQPNNGSSDSTLAATTNLGSLTIVTLQEGQLAGGATYRISPDPFTGAGNYTIIDGDVGKDKSTIAGIISLDDISDGEFYVIQLSGPEGRSRDIIPRIATITNGSAGSVTFESSPSSRASQNSGGIDLEGIQSILYAAKFECGSIHGSEGPLRPGHYDTDIGIFNKQDFPVKITWSAANNDDEQSNALLKTLSPQSSTSIVCNDIRGVLGVGEAFSEGFVLIEVPVDPMLVASLSGPSSVLESSSQDRIDVLDVQIFYTANALDDLPHQNLVNKISFSITSNGTITSLPSSIIGKVLDITLPVEFGEISDPEEKVKEYLSQKYNITATDVAKLKVQVIDVDVGIGTMIDDHAISLSKVKPQAIAS